MYKVALVLVPFKDRVLDTISIPLGLAWLNSFLRMRLSDKVTIDNYDLLLEPERETTLLEKVKDKKYDLVGIQAHADVTVHECLRIAEMCKRLDPALKTVIGGNAATFLKTFFLNYSFIDFVVIGEGELTFYELIERFINNRDPKEVKGIAFKIRDQEIVTAARPLIESLDEIPPPDRDAFEWRKYPQWSIITSRGCPYRCIFCSSTKFWQNRIRFRSPGNIYDEILFLSKKYGMRTFYILDDTFGVNRTQTRELLSLLIKGNEEFKWACLTRGDIVNEDMLTLFKRAGCVELHFGLESANKKTLRYIGKNLDIDQLRASILIAKKLGLLIKTSVIFGLPGESKPEIMNTVQFLCDIEPNEVQIYPLMAYIGTDVYEHRERYAVEILDEDLSHWRKDAENPLTQTRLLPRQKIIQLAHLAVEKLRKKGYIWIPVDAPPRKLGLIRSVKTVFAPIQGLDTKRSS